MPVPFGTRVVDKNGKGVGTVSRVVLHSGSRHVSGLVVHQGVLDRRQIVVPIAKVSSFGDEVRLTLSASGLAGLDLYNAESLQLMPDQWEMPAGFDQREFFLVGGDGWTEAVLPFERTSSRPRRSSAPPRTQLERREGSSCEAAPKAAGEAYFLYVEPAVEGAVPPQLGPYPRSSPSTSRIWAPIALFSDHGRPAVMPPSTTIA
jgi:hypothetical protein